MRVGAARILAFTVLATLGLGMLGAATASATVPGSPAPTPVVSGSHLVDTRSGDTWVPHGVNWPSFEYACYQGWGYAADGRGPEAAAAVVSWHINTVRLPLNQDCWLGLNGTPAGDGETVAGYRQAVADFVTTMNAAGLVVILDLHLNAPVGSAAHDQYPMADAQSLTFWTSVASAYKSNLSVLFDAFNEPYSRYDGNTKVFDLTWDCWQNGGCLAPAVDQGSPRNGHTYPVVGMSALVAAIRATGAAQPILLGGTDYSNDLTGWLAHKPADGQLIASWHNYPGQRCDHLSCWNSEIAPVAQQVPVFTGEFGEDDGGSSYLTTFMPWADAHGIGYAPWAWWEVASAESVTNARYALITDLTSFAPKAPSGTTYRTHLLSLPVTTPPDPPVDPPASNPVTLKNPGFEGSRSSWTSHTGHITSGLVTTTAHTGDSSLAVRASGSGREVDQTVATSVEIGDTFAGTVWMRSAAGTIRAKLRLSTTGAATEYRDHLQTVGTEWTAVAVSLPIKHSKHTGIRLSIFPSSVHTVYLDDAALTRAR
jgi:endoglucanase